MTINWNLIKTASGFAGHIPEAIERLASANAEDRENAYWGIDNYAMLQSDLYEAAYYVIEPVLELLEKKYTVNRLLPLTILIEIALGGNGNEIIKLIDNRGKEKSIYQACMDKLKFLYDRISAIEVVEEDEKAEKTFLLETIREL